MPDASDDKTLSFSSGETFFSTIGPYRLVKLLGEGGMGEVWLAEQNEPIHRAVALKLIKAGMDTKTVIARFESERQALALMDHPNIARVFDGGSTPEGRPYFVMEYVPGIAINRYCDKHELTFQQRLELFMDVCDGVQHAHQKAIIHRDLKPSNILVHERDDKPVAKIIDFGLAKAIAISDRPADQTMFTQVGAVVGTPEYMSPEQTDLSQGGVDTRTDVYSLGVILYETLMGVLPFENETLHGSSPQEIVQKLREVDPPRPSTRIKSLGDMSKTLAEHRKIEPRTFVHRLSGELDWITMKALEKERSPPLWFRERVVRGHPALSEKRAGARRSTERDVSRQKIYFASSIRNGDRASSCSYFWLLLRLRSRFKRGVSRKSAIAPIAKRPHRSASATSCATCLPCPIRAKRKETASRRAKFWTKPQRKSRPAWPATPSCKPA